MTNDKCPLPNGKPRTSCHTCPKVKAGACDYSARAAFGLYGEGPGVGVDRRPLSGGDRGAEVAHALRA